MRASSAGTVVLIVGLTVAGCGGGSPASPTSLSATGRLAIALQVVLAALGGFAPGSAVVQSDRVPLGNLTCQTTCTGGSCAISCPIDERFDCPAGGRVTDKGRIEGTLDASLSGDAPLTATQTYEACRVTPGTGTLTRGPYNLGLLFFTKAVPNAEVFYCPSGSKVGVKQTYKYYLYTGTWPSTPPVDPDGQPEDNVRTCYNYYPQVRELELFQGYMLPTLAYANYFDSGSGKNISEPVPLKTHQVDPNKTVSTDLLHNLKALPHKSGGSGVNALFPDSHIRFETVRAKSSTLGGLSLPSEAAAWTA